MATSLPFALTALALAVCACDDDAPAPPPIYQPPPPTLTPPRRPPEIAPEIVPLPPRPNPYTDELERRRKAWLSHGLKNYVYVLQDLGQISEVSEQHRRIVVKDGVGVDSQSLTWGGRALAAAVTMDDMFEKAHYFATFGDGDVPFKFVAEYDEQYDFVSKMDSDGRETVADDEHDFRVECFSAEPAGCRPILLTPKQCQGAGGQVLQIGSTECAYLAIGLVGSDRFCCRTLNPSGMDEMTAAQCRSAGGVEDECTRGMIDVGGSQKREQGCCRRFVK